jgi:methyltransferase
MSAVLFVLSVIAGLMLAETRLSRRHERRLLAEGAVAPHGDVYRTLAILYPAAFVLMGAEGAWHASAPAPKAEGLGPETDPSWFAAGLVMFIAGKALKYWAIRTLGERWSFRVFIQPGRPLVATGPYQYLAHPNYVGVVGELVGAAMMFGARYAGPVMIALMGLALAARIRFENRALRTGV